MCEVCFGSKGYYLVLFCMCLFEMGTMCAYFIISGDCLAHVVQHLFGIDGLFAISQHNLRFLGAQE